MLLIIYSDCRLNFQNYKSQSLIYDNSLHCTVHTPLAVRIMMITGDSKETAVAIAREVNIFGILEDVTDSAYTSREFFALPMETQLRVLKKGNKVFCRAEPKDKQILISMLEKLGEVTGKIFFFLM